MNGVRLLLVNSHGTDVSVGGTEGYVAKLAEGFAARGAEVSVLSAFPGASTVPAERTRALHDTDWRDDRRRRRRNHLDDVVSRPSRKLADAIAWAGPDVVHTHNLPGITTGVWEVARRAGAAVVHTIHDYHLLCPRVTLLRPDGEPCRPHPLLCGLRTRSLARWADRVSHVLGVSQYVIDRHAALFRRAQLAVVRHPFDPSPQRAFRPPGDRLRTVGYVGALAKTKGTDRLLAALPAIGELGLEVRMAGEGRLQAEVSDAAARSPVLQYDGFVGGQAKDAFLEACDVGIVPSVWPEPGGPPWAMLEWLWAGRPVLVSPRGGLAEALETLPGSLPVEPTTEGIVSALARLTDGDAWTEARAAVQPLSDPGAVDRWFDVHERAYREAMEARA
jgi:glycosyltransferase involved in cell wall biosynthesis